MSFYWSRRFTWTARVGHRKELWLQAGWCGWRQAWLSLSRWVRMRSWIDLKFDLYSRVGQHECYCPTGRTTRVIINVFGASLNVELSRSWRRSPCLCDRVSWCVSPEWHKDEIEDYGRDRLIAEFPEHRTALETCQC